MNAPAGWYDDGSGRQRWWDGSQWTEHFFTQADAAASAQQAVEAPVADVAGTAESASFAPPYVMAANVTTPAVPDAVAAPGYPGYPVYPLAYPAVPQKRGVSVLGVIGLCVAGLGIVLSCIPPIAAAGWCALGIGLVLSIVSLFLRGAKWPGFIGIGAGGFGAILALAVALIAIVPSEPTDPEAGGSSAEGGSTVDDDPADAVPSDPSEIEGAVMTSAAELKVGDCIPLLDYDDEDWAYELPVVPCDTPHTDEVFFVYEADDGEFPGDEALQEAAWTRCVEEFEKYVGIRYDESELELYTYQPTKSSWNHWDDRAIQCVLYSYEDVTGSLAGSAR